MYRRFLTPDATREFQKELDYSKKHWGKQHVGRYARELKAVIASICKNPFVYPERREILPDMRIATHKGNRILYTVNEEKKQVVVIGVLSIYQNIEPEKLRKRMISILS